METYTPPRRFVQNADFRHQRQRCLTGLQDAMIDRPIVRIIDLFNTFPFCFTLQCCYGHFILPGEQNLHTLDPLPALDTGQPVQYRIAYVAFCLDNCKRGRRLLADLKSLVTIDPPTIQFGSATWFWERQVNSYVLQVEPQRFKDQDSAMLDYPEAIHIEKIRNAFFSRLETILRHHSADGR